MFRVACSVIFRRGRGARLGCDPGFRAASGGVALNGRKDIARRSGAEDASGLGLICHTILGVECLVGTKESFFWCL